MLVKIRKKPISITLSEDNLYFIDVESKATNKSRSEIVEEVLSTYKKYKLEKTIQEGFICQEKENREMAETGMEDYYNILKNYEES